MRKSLFNRWFGRSEEPGREASGRLKSSNPGDAESQFELGLMCSQGTGVPRSEETALLWLRSAAAMGHPGAQYHLGVRLYRASKGSRRDEASRNRVEAFKYLQLACIQHYEGAEAALEFVALEMTWQEVKEGCQTGTSGTNNSS